MGGDGEKCNVVNSDSLVNEFHSDQLWSVVTPSGVVVNRTKKGVMKTLLFISLHTLVQLDDMAADEPDQIGEVRHGCFVPDVV